VLSDALEVDQMVCQTDIQCKVLNPKEEEQPNKIHSEMNRIDPIISEFPNKNKPKNIFAL